MIWLVLLLVAWLWLTRICVRWTLELGRPLSERSSSYILLACLAFWWLGLPRMWNEYARRSGKRHRMVLQKLAGESRWHRRNRLEQVHRERCEDLDVPET